MYLAKASVRQLHICLSTDIDKLLHTIDAWYITNYNCRSKYIQKLVKHWGILSYVFFTPRSLLVSIALTVINTFSACQLDFHVGWINQGTLGAALKSRCTGHSESSVLLSCSLPGSMPAAQLSSLSFALSMAQFELSQSSVSEMLRGALSSSLSTGWRLILLIWRTFHICVCPPGRSFADTGGGNGDLSDNLNAAAPSCWKSDEDALTLTPMSERYPRAVICLFWARDCFWVARRFCLPCHISEKSRTLAILCNFHSAASFFISKTFSVFIVSNSGSVQSKIPWLAWANCLTMTFLRKVSTMVFDCLQPITSRPREKLASTPTPCGMIKNMSRTRTERLGYFECVSSCWCHQSVMSGNQYELLISIGSEWDSLRCGLICPQSFCVSGGEFK